MKNQRRFVLSCAVLLSSILLLTSYAVGQKKSKYACLEAEPQKLCSAENTCGSASNPCTVNIKRTAYAASATASIANPKSNALFCVKAGTTVTWQSTAKNTGFVIDFGPSSPFDSSDAIIGGANRPISVAAKKPGCYRYSAGACVSGAVKGMCGSTEAEAIVLGQ